MELKGSQGRRGEKRSKEGRRIADSSSLSLSLSVTHFVSYRAQREERRKEKEE